MTTCILNSEISIDIGKKTETNAWKYSGKFSSTPRNQHPIDQLQIFGQKKGDRIKQYAAMLHFATVAQKNFSLLFPNPL